jgi:hypothetical protein
MLPVCAPIGARSLARRHQATNAQVPASRRAGQQAARFSATKEDDPAYVYLPPGCSISDPTYGVSTSDPIYHLDNAPRKVGQPSHVPYRPAPAKQAAPAAPASITTLPGSMAEAESLKLAWSTCSAKTRQQQPAGSLKQQEADGGTYVYLPPGSSMKEPIYISLSDPVYFADPKPKPY